MNEFKEMWFKLKERITGFVGYYEFMQNKPKHELCKIFLEMMEDIEQEHGITVVTVKDKDTKKDKVIKADLLKMTIALLNPRKNNKNKEYR